RRVREKWNIIDPRHLRNRGATANVDENSVGLKNFIVDHNSVGRLKAGMALDDCAILKSSQPLLYALVRPPGDFVLACFDALHIDTHVTIGKTIIRASASNVGRVGAG